MKVKAEYYLGKISNKPVWVPCTIVKENEHSKTFRIVFFDCFQGVIMEKWASPDEVRQ